MDKPVIIALDVATPTEMMALLDQFDPESRLFVKIGMELFYHAGPDIVRNLKKRGHRIFLDLKLHDIPNTVEQAMRQLAMLSVDLVTVHALGGVQMIAAAKNGLVAGALQAGVTAPKLLAVTQLTSTSQVMLNEEQGIPGTVAASTAHLAAMALSAGADGLIASAADLPTIGQALGQLPMAITPGIRPTNSPVGDQVRVTSPSQAAALGSAGIVVGRPIIAAADPVESYQQILTEWRNANAISN